MPLDEEIQKAKDAADANAAAIAESLDAFRRAYASVTEDETIAGREPYTADRFVNDLAGAWVRSLQSTARTYRAALGVASALAPPPE